ncbi:amino acid adenylation domain-containing protein [Nocardia sp. 2]|uniref:Amino acid adenylation domain-containing protein n=1 Tax=Nocardia acididurans TaxID=2802282 RepID=A0ABS1M5A0_9NOCA|nr:non-ribosomal peptide synthetase [Nocardia acididurans]MBL1075355.1 amino acid adenylation domain-containing protein [Nocardia acididurans]
MELWLADEFGTHDGSALRARALPGQAHYLQLHGELDAELFDAASHRAFEEFGVGRLRIGVADGRPYQWMAADIGGGLERVDFGDRPDPLGAALEWMDRRHRLPIDLIDAPLWAAALLRVGPRHHIWYAQMHHVAIDGYGGLSLIVRIGQWYEALLAGGEPAPYSGLSPAEIQAADAEYRASGRFEADRDYWRERFADWTAPVPAAAAPRYHRRSGALPPAIRAAGTLSPENWDRLEDLAAACVVSPAQLLVAAIGAFQAGMSGNADPMVLLATSARTTAALKRSGGMLANVLPLRLRCAGATTVRELVEAAARETTGGLRHQRYRCEDIRRSLGVAPDQVLGPSVNLMFFDRTSRFGAAVGEYCILSSGSVADLHFNLYRAGAEAGLSVDLLANPDRYGRQALDVHLHRFLMFLENFIAAAPDEPVARVALLSDAELRRIAHAPSVTEAARTSPGLATSPELSGAEPVLLPDLLAAAVARNESAPAVICGENSLSYRELDELSNRLARSLCQRGLGPGDVIAVAARRSVEWVIAFWAIAKTGAAYLPIDPDHPADRIAAILRESGARAGIDLTPTELPDFTAGGPGWLVLEYPAGTRCGSTGSGSDPTASAGRDPASVWLRGMGAALTDADRMRPLRLEHPAYVIYTSGSTGMPKGVVVTHGGLAEVVAAQSEWMRVDSDSRVLCMAATTFDASIWELTLAAGGGAALVVSAGDAYAGPLLADLIRRKRVTHAFITPAALAGTDPAGLTRLRYLATGGEACPQSVVSAWAPGRTLVNVYGPTEATIVTNIGPLVADRPVFLGASLPGVRCHVLDAWLRPVPAGVVGELYLAGPGLARGYLGRPGTTAARFVADPFAPGERLYRTGDLVVRDGDGELEFRGRTDFQVKVRGLRIELGEIEAVLAGYPGVAQAVVVVHGAQDAPRIVAYAVPAPGALLAACELESTAAQHLPSYMVPTVILLDRLPLTGNGKVDRAALPAPAAVVVAYRAPITAVEKVVAAAFAQVVCGVGGTRRIGLDDDFFALGGDSLTAALVVARVAAEAGVEVGVRDLFEASTVAALANRVTSRNRSADRTRLTRRPRPEVIPVSGAQQRLWLLNRIDPESAAYNMLLALRLTGTVRVEALTAALRDVVERHEALRTSFVESDGLVCQRFCAADTVVGALVPEPVQADKVHSVLGEFGAVGFDLTAAPPIRVRLLAVPGDDRAPDHHVLAVLVHHVIADGFSLGPFARDLAVAYEARVRGGAPGWLPLPVQYADYALWQRDMLGSESDPDSVLSRQLAYWSDLLAGLPAESGLPPHRPRTTAGSRRAAEVRTEIPADIARRIHELARRQGATPFMVLHAALSVLLAAVSGGGDIAVGTPVAGRGAAVLDDLIGMFVNTLVLRVRVDPAEPFTNLLARVRDTDLGAFATEVPFERVVEALDPPRSRTRNPLFQVMLSYRTPGRTEFELAGLRVEPLEIPSPLAKFDLEFTLAEGASGLALALRYATDLFDRDGMEVLAGRLCRVLDRISRDPGLPVGDIDLLTGAERDRVLRRWNDTSEAVPLTLPQLLTRAAAYAPEAEAVVCGEATLTYRELGDRSHRLARTLIESGVGPEDVVAVALPRSLEWVVAVCAVAHSGAAFLPVDPSAPTERVSRMLADSAAAVGITSEEWRSELPALVTGRWLVVDPAELAGPAAPPVTDADRVRPLRLHNPAYVMYTSGSTGTPKGVAVSHGGLANVVVTQAQRCDSDPGTRVLAVAAPGFDASVWELLQALATGATLVVAPAWAYAGEDLLDLMVFERITHAMLTPRVLATLPDPERVPQLRMLATAGETCPPELAATWSAGRCLVNAYGPTEATIWSTVSCPLQLPDPVTPVPIGTPVVGARCYVLDDRLRPVPPGMMGEIYVAGPGLARGYHHRPGLTGAAFVADPYGPPGDRMYRTGDRGSWTTAGDLEFHGRTDFQVKIRGVRIELAEIEAALTALPGVADAAALLRRASSTSIVGGTAGGTAAGTAETNGGTAAGTAQTTGSPEIFAYVVAAPGATLEQSELRAAVARCLPDQYVPAVVTVLDRLPLTLTGKVDRAALPVPVRPRAEFRSPGTTSEQAVARVFGQVLGVDEVGGLDDFFALGGHSLTATRVIALLRAETGVTLPLRDLFEHPTVSALATRLDAAARAGGVDVVVRAAAADPAAGEDVSFREAPSPETGAAVRAHGTVADLVPRGRPERVPLSFAQQGIWLLDRMGARSAYHILLALRLTGDLDVAALAAAVADVVARHEALRTYFPEVDGVPYQVVAQADIGALEIRRVPADGLERALDEFECEPFDLAAAPPLRARLYAVEGRQWVLAMVVHHVNADGVSLAPLARDLSVAYTARSAGSEPEWPVLPLQYADYSVWQHTVLGAAEDPASELNRLLAYWVRTMAGAPLEMSVRSDRPRPEIARHAGSSVEWAVPQEISERTRQLARARHASLFMVAHAALAILVSKLSGSGDVVIGAPTAGREAAGLDDLVGMFVNSVPLRVPVDPDEPFTLLLDRVRDIDVDAFAHARAPFERIVEALDPPRAGGRHPIFQIALAVNNFDQPEVRLPGVRVEPVRRTAATVRFDLEFDLTETDAGTTVTLRYDTALFDAESARTLLGRFERVLAQVVSDPDLAVRAVDIVDPAEKARLLREWNSAGAADPITLPELLSRAVALAPDASAVVFGDSALTYRELDERSNRLAGSLIRRDAGPERVVAVALRRSLDWIVALWAVAKTGAAYLPVDPGLPEQRIRRILADSGAVLGITSESLRSALPEFPEPVRPWLVLDAADTQEELTRADAAPITNRVRPRLLDSAYIIYTSGSTGEPKGVTVTHAGLADILRAQAEHCAPHADSRVLQLSAPSFDASVWELLLAVGAAATLVIADPDVYGGPELTELLRRERITHAFITPAVLAGLDPAALSAPNSPAALPVLVTGGEAVPATVAAQWSSGRSLLIAYGPTETTIISHLSAPYTGGAVTIGRPGSGVRCYVLDDRLALVPPGVTGELYTAGAGVARGYHRRPGPTAARFVADPFTGGRMYRTGDLVRHRPDGELEFVGRNDSQVKVRGLRIELGEIEAAARNVPGVAQAVAAVSADHAGEPRLLVQAVADPHCASGPCTEAQLREALARTLPAYMVPASIVVRDRLPLTVNGKVDRRVLAEGPATCSVPRDTPAPALPDVPVDPPRTSAEQVVAQVFAEVLGLPQVGADADFFRLGGNSLSATRVASRLGAALHIQLPVREVFDAPTVAGLAERLRGHEGAPETAARPALVATPRPEPLPLSPAQQRLWLLHQLDPDSAAYNIPLVLRLRGRLAVDALASAVRYVLDRHESLRTYYPEVDGVVCQRIVPVAESSTGLEVFEADFSADLSTAVHEFCTAPFDPTSCVPVRAALFTVNAGEWLLAFVIHHANADGFSLGPLARDLAEGYAAALAGTAPDRPALPVQYADYTLWQRRTLGSTAQEDSEASRQIGYWVTALAGLPADTGLPLDHPRPVRSSQRGATVSVELPESTAERLRAVARAQDGTLFMTLHAGLAVLLSAWSGTSDIAIGTPVAGRGEAALDDQVGMFVNTLVLRTEVAAAEPFSEFLRRVREIDLEAFAHADIPFEQVVEVLDPPRSQARHPLFQVLLAVQNLDPVRLDLAGLEVEPVATPATTSRFDLEFIVTQHDAGLAVAVHYATDLFDRSTVEALAERYLLLLEQVSADPRVRTARIGTLTSREYERTVREWNSTETADKEIQLADLLATAARRAPSAEAVRCGDVALSYIELRGRAADLARCLAGLDIGSEDVVALGMSRSLPWVVAFWGVARSGAAFMPVDPGFPELRRAAMLRDAAVRIVITTEEHAAAFIGAPQSCVIVLGTEGQVIRTFSATTLHARADALPPIVPVRAGNAAYVIHTSGSTGAPKGVVVTHAGLANLAAAQARCLGADEKARVLCVASPTFDVSVWELMLAVGAAATLVVAPPDVYAGEPLTRLMREERITHAFVTPAVLACTEPKGLRSLAAVVTGGEACPQTVVDAWGGKRRIVNAYGPTETTVICTLSGALAADQPVTIGRPVAGVRCYVLDACLRPMPVGATGELYLGGPGLARGYLGHPEVTAGRFVADPFGSGERLYRTGDLVSWTSEGELNYQGRTDFQVKIRGIRVELGEVEAAVAAAPHVANAVAVHTDGPAGGSLVAYVVAEPGRKLNLAKVTAAAAQRLPDYLVPAIVPLEQLPMLVNGKVDRSALPPAPVAQPQYRRPATAAERTVAAAVTDILELDRAGRDDDFFALGGNSLSAARLVSRLDGRIALRDVFEAPTVTALAQRLRDRPVADDVFDIVLPLRGGDGETLFCVHPGGGLAWPYAGLLPHLGEAVSLYGIQDPWVLHGEAPMATIRDYAERYVREIRRIQPCGPYRLLGWSLGGRIAHETALLLQAQGERISMLALMDSAAADGTASPAPSSEDIAAAWRELTGTESIAQVAAALPPALIERATAALTRQVPGLPGGVFDGDILHFTATRETDRTRDPARSWAAHVTGRVTDIAVDATHIGMAQPIPLARIGATLAGHWSGE